MPKGEGAPGKLLGRQEMDLEHKAMASLTEAIEQSKLSKGAYKAEDAHSGPLDGEHCDGERFAIYFEVEKQWGLAPSLWTNLSPLTSGQMRS